MLGEVAPGGQDQAVVAEVAVVVLGGVTLNLYLTVPLLDDGECSWSRDDGGHAASQTPTTAAWWSPPHSAQPTMSPSSGGSPVPVQPMLCPHASWRTASGSEP